MPAFPTGRSAPTFLRVGGKLTRKAEVLLENATSPQGWYARWTHRTLGVPPATGATLTRLLLAELAKRGRLEETITDSHALAYALSPDRIVVHATTDADLADRRHLLRCGICHAQHYGTV